MSRPPLPAPGQWPLAQARGRVTVQVAVALTLLLAALGAAVHRTAASGQDAAARRRLLRSLFLAEAAGLLAAPLIGQIVSRRALAPVDDALARRRRFAADVAHELRAPLTRLHTRAQLVAGRLRDGSDVSADVDRLVDGTRQLAELVEDLLVSAHQGRWPTLAPVDLGRLADELAEAESPHDLGVTIEVVRRGDGHVVHGAEPALRRVLSALVDNALRGTGRHVRVTLARTPAAVELIVSDDGAGFDPRDAERLFARYQSGGTDGFGLGLALAREVVDGHGGTITADGRPGAGAVFTVRLPAAPQSRAGGV